MHSPGNLLSNNYEMFTFLLSTNDRYSNGRYFHGILCVSLSMGGWRYSSEVWAKAWDLVCE